MNILGFCRSMVQHTGHALAATANAVVPSPVYNYGTSAIQAFGRCVAKTVSEVGPFAATALLAAEIPPDDLNTLTYSFGYVGIPILASLSCGMSIRSEAAAFGGAMAWLPLMYRRASVIPIFVQKILPSLNAGISALFAKVLPIQNHRIAAAAGTALSTAICFGSSFIFVGSCLSCYTSTSEFASDLAIRLSMLSAIAAGLAAAIPSQMIAYRVATEVPREKRQELV